MNSGTEAGWESVDGVAATAGRNGSQRRGRAINILELNRPRDLRDIANLGLTLSEAKQLLFRLQ